MATMMTHGQRAARGSESGQAVARRAVLGTLAAVGAGLAGAACGAARQTSAPQGPAAPAAKARGPVTFAHWWAPPAPWGVAMQDQALPGVAKAYPQITVESQVFAWGDIMPKLQAWLAAGTVPDMTMIQPQNFTPLYVAGAFTSLEPFIAREPAFSRRDFYPSSLERVTKQGQLFGVPTDVNIFVLYWNQALFALEGVKPPTAAWTWDEMLTAARQLTRGTAAEDRRYGLFVPPWEIAVWASGGEVLSRDDRSVRLHEPPAFRAIAWLADLIHKHQIAPPRNQNALNLFQAGRLGMLLDGTHVLGQLRNAKVEFPWDIAQVPRWQRRATIIQGASLAIFKDGKNRDGAWEVLKYLSSVEVQRYWGRAGLLPARPSAADSFLRTPPDNVRAIVDSTPFSRPRPFVARYTEMMDIINRELKEVIDENRKPAQQAAEAIKREVDPLLAS